MKDDKDRAEVQRALNFLAGLPTGNTTLTRKQLTMLLLETDGWMLSRGRPCDIKSKRIGPGVYRVTLHDQSAPPVTIGERLDGGER